MTQSPFIADFFLAGAPRCGTTSLSKYLRAHPQICFSSPKETFFFTENPDPTSDQLQTDYRKAFYAHYDPHHHALVGEGSVHYLFAPDTLRTILKINPEARFIAMVRNPLEMLPSFYARMRYVLEEDAESFREAWKLQDARASGEHLPAACSDPMVLQYRTIGKLGHHIETLFEIAGRERCLVIVHDDFAEDPRRSYDLTLKFLGLPAFDLPEYGRHQPLKSYRSQALQKLLWKPPARASRLARTSKQGPLKQLLRRARKRLVHWNRAPGVREELAPEFRAELLGVFGDDVAYLGELLGRDLSSWLRK